MSTVMYPEIISIGPRAWKVQISSGFAVQGRHGKSALVVFVSIVQNALSFFRLTPNSLDRAVPNPPKIVSAVTQ